MRNGVEGSAYVNRMWEHCPLGGCMSHCPFTHGCDVTLIVPHLTHGCDVTLIVPHLTQGCDVTLIVPDLTHGCNVTLIVPHRTQGCDQAPVCT